MPRRLYVLVVLIVGLWCLGVFSGLSTVAAASFKVSPELLEIGAFFDGARVEVAADIPNGAQAVLEVMGQQGKEELLRKGRRGGLWMAVGEIQVHNAPSLYLVLSSAPEIPTLKEGEAPWGFGSLQQKAKFQGRLDAGEEPKLFQEFLELKKSEGLYLSLPGVLRCTNPGNGRALVKGSFELPPKVPPGIYQVRLSVLEDGRIVEQRPGILQVKMVGFPALLATLAYNHGGLYGILAVVIAIATGFLTGFLFKGKAGH